MQRITIYNEKLNKTLRKEDAQKTKERISSGKISPSKLAKPTLEACLQLLGVQADPPSDQSLRNFLRGNTLEPIALKAIKARWSPDQLQVACTYRNCIGYADGFYKVPHEVKAPGAYGWKLILQNDKPKNDHCIQATYYALAKGTNSSWIHYINSEGYLKIPYELASFKVKASDYRDQVDQRIDAIHNCFLSGKLPNFESLEEYHDNIKYSSYSLFHKKKGDQAENILKQYYPEAYAKLKSGELIERIIKSGRN